MNIPTSAPIYKMSTLQLYLYLCSLLFGYRREFPLLFPWTESRLTVQSTSNNKLTGISLVPKGLSGAVPSNILILHPLSRSHTTSRIRLPATGTSHHLHLSVFFREDKQKRVEHGTVSVIASNKRPNKCLVRSKCHAFTSSHPTATFC